VKCTCALYATYICKEGRTGKKDRRKKKGKKKKPIYLIGLSVASK